MAKAKVDLKEVFAKGDPNHDQFVTFQKMVLKEAAIANAPSVEIHITYDQSTPINITQDDDEAYIASYEDNFGTYSFTIVKDDDGDFVVTSQGVVVHVGSDAKYIIWNFETQVAVPKPIILGG